nr:GDSL esterase/lipase At1g29670-like [Tanacetum cinerariifolium]
TAFSEDGLSVIATKLGTSLMLDSYTSDIYIISWGRGSIRVMLMLSMFPLRCACCKVFGHAQDECPKNIDSDVVKNMKKLSQTHRGQLLGFAEFIPPYATATDQEISTGVNYGSGSAGIREESGSHLGDRISLDRQLQNHVTTISRLSSVLQSNKTFTNEYLKQCIYLTNIGSNDYINNYLIPNIYLTSNIYTVDEYAAVLVEQYSQQLKTLYDLGARKVAVFGLGQIGCAPAEIARFGTNGKPCVEWINDAVKIFNEHLRSLINELNNDYTDARLTFINLTSISAPQGGEDGQCVPNSTPCLLRALSVFYDGFHPTETANTVIAARSYIALSPMDASPYDISHLARL